MASLLSDRPLAPDTTLGLVMAVELDGRTRGFEVPCLYHLSMGSCLYVFASSFRALQLGHLRPF